MGSEHQYEPHGKMTELDQESGSQTAAAKLKKENAKVVRDLIQTGDTLMAEAEGPQTDLEKAIMQQLQANQNKQDKYNIVLTAGIAILMVVVLIAFFVLSK